MDLSRVILRPLNTEKSYLLREQKNQYAFVVAPHATKKHIKMAFEAIFQVVPLAVNTTIRKPKPTRYMAKGRKGSTKLMKIAYVSLPAGISLNESESKEPEANSETQAAATPKEGASE